MGIKVHDELATDYEDTMTTMMNIGKMTLASRFWRHGNGISDHSLTAIPSHPSWNKKIYKPCLRVPVNLPRLVEKVLSSYHVV